MIHPGTCSRKTFYGMLLSIVVIACGTYANAIANQLTYDDFFQIINNPWITDIRYIPAIFTKDVWSFDSGYAQSHNFYRPMMHMVYLATYHFSGLKPWGYHLVSLLLHVLVSLMVFLVGRRLFSDTDQQAIPPYLNPSFVAALLFAVHPIHVEAVAWAAAIPELLYTLFCLASFYLYITANEDNNRIRTIQLMASALLFFCATLSKETALVFPGILVAYDVAFKKFGRRFGNAVIGYLPYLTVCALYLVIRVTVIGSFVAGRYHDDMSGPQTVLNIVVVLAKYVQKLIFPVNLNAVYGFHPVQTYTDTTFLLSFVFLTVVATIVARYARTSPVAIFSAALIVIPLLPVLYIPALATPFAERYLYLPSFGFVLLVALATARLAARYNQVIVAVVGLSVLAAGYSYGSVLRNSVWRNELSLWADVVEKTPDMDIVHTNYGVALAENWRLEEAATQFAMAIAINPKADKAYNGLGMTQFKLSRISEAVSSLEEAVRINPSYGSAHANLGKVLMAQGRVGEAMSHLNEALRIDPGDATANYFLGEAQRLSGAMNSR